jgi:hypothetical protein
MIKPAKKAPKRLRKIKYDYETTMQMRFKARCYQLQEGW